MMDRTKKPAARIDQPRPSANLKALRENLELDAKEWQQFLRHALAGFVDYERATSIDPDVGLRLRDVPTEWWGSPEPIGYVFLRVARRTQATLAVPVAWYLLQMYNQEVDFDLIPPGTGLAWLHLARAGLAPPVEPAELTRQALVDPNHFFEGITDDDLLPLCCLVLEGGGTIQAWDLHAVVAAVHRADVHVRAPFRLFEGLVTADWISLDLKREFCRGLLGCHAEAQRLRERRKALKSAMDADCEVFFKTPRAWCDLTDWGIASRLPTLKRHAIFALVENFGEPVLEIVSEFFLKNYGAAAATEAVSEGVLDLIGRHAEELGPEVVRKLIGKAIKRGLAPVRQAAYRIGAEQFGLNFVRPALRDEAGLVRNWAAKLLKTKRLQPARKTTSKRRSGTSPVP